MDPSSLVASVQVHFQGRIRATSCFRGQACVVVAVEDLLEVLAGLVRAPDMGMDTLLDIVGVDLLGLPFNHRFEVIWNLRSTVHGHRLRVKIELPDPPDPVPSTWELWKSANWLEREVFDLFGIRFEGHPNLQRILCHHRFEGHALRKDYPIQRRQPLDVPIVYLLTDDPEHA